MDSTKIVPVVNISPPSSDATRRDSQDGIRRMGYLKKLKTMKKKFFVLRESSGDKAASLDYYDGERKFRSGHPAKRSVPISGCFAVNLKEDCKQKHAISVFTTSDTFTVLTNGPGEENEWFQDLLALQQTAPGSLDAVLPVGRKAPEVPFKPTFEYVWNVDIQKKGLGQTRNIMGPYRLCLIDRSLKLVPLNSGLGSDTMTFSLVKLRKVGYKDKDIYVYLEVGRSACTGPGDLCMAAEDQLSAKHMHDTISEVMRRGGGLEEANQATGHRVRSNTGQDSSRPRHDNRRNTYELANRQQQQPVAIDGDIGSREVKDASGSSSNEKMNRTPEQRIPEYFVPEFCRATSTEENYLPIDTNSAYFTCSYAPKQTAPAEQPNYSAIARFNEGQFSPPVEQTTENRSKFAPSIPEEPGDYMPITIAPSSSQATLHNEPIKNSSEESGYFEMNLPAKSEPEKFSTPTEKTDPEPNGYMMMAPSSGASSSGISDSRRSTMSNSSYQSHASDREEHADTMGEVTYAIMESFGPRSRGGRDNSNWDTSSSSSSFGWDRYGSFGSRPDYRLDKVKAFMVLEDQDPKLRETRAYSTGCQPSKPSSSFKPDYSPQAQCQDAYRIRAFSLGNHSSPATARTNRRGVVHSPSAAVALGSLPCAVNNAQDVRGEITRIRQASGSDTQLIPQSQSSLSVKSVDSKKVVSEPKDRANEVLMEMNFRPRCGT